MRKLFLLLIFIVFVLIGGYFYYLPLARWHKAAVSAGGYPYQIGLTNTRVGMCQVSCNGGCCIGQPTQDGILCTLKTAVDCTLYEQINGTMSGGMGTMALFSIPNQISMAGYKPGDSIIAGGMTMSEMGNGVLATPGGCAGCGMGKADSSVIDRIARVAGYIIAGFRDKIK
ncbi:MAG: hypothetical protein V1801_01035 [Candidatus Falkowbacteria bacterium]